MQGYDLKQELELATQVALKAGAALREEFHREGGPRSNGRSHAAVDAEVEVVIREALRAAFPGDAFVGEETGTQGPRDARRTWYVDPHDGTSAFNDGHRGSAVSIGLVDDALPVLGVVYAPTAPDDRGDLITWAEGELLTRNGLPVLRERLPEKLGPDSVVAFYAGAATGEHLAYGLGLARPGRILARPSIAWRLALVAVGEADAAVSLSGPAAYDVAAGHALLRAVRGELMDARGVPVRYGRDEPGPGNVFGGHPEVAAKLASRHAKRRRPAPLTVDPLSTQFPHTAPRRDRRVRDADVLARAQGALLGQVVGDALGAQVEFEPRIRIFQRFPGGVRELADGGPFQLIAGQPTDDSEMALMLARSIVARGGFDDAAAKEAYLAWLGSDPFDVGTTTRRGLAGEDTGASEANGSAMRVSPLAVHLWRNDPEAVCSEVVKDVVLTHESPVCVEATVIYAAAIALAVREGLSPRALYDRVATWVRRDPVFETAVKAIFLEDDVAPVKDFQTNQGWVLIALRNAFHQLLHAPSFEEGVVRTVSQGGDADTNGAIVGALLGAVFRREAVPLRWRRTVLSCRAVSGQQVRPSPFWADDLYDLAEQLVATGPLHTWVSEEPVKDGGITSLSVAREQRQQEAQALARLEAAAREVLPLLAPLQSAAAELAVFSGLPVPADLRPDERGVSAGVRGLVKSRSPQAAAAGRALELIEQLAHAVRDHS